MFKHPVILMVILFVFSRVSGTFATVVSENMNSMGECIFALTLILASAMSLGALLLIVLSVIFECNENA